MGDAFGIEFQHLTESVADLGFDGVVYSFYPKPSYVNEKIQPMLHFSEAFAPFVDHYMNHDYWKRDFVLRLAMKGRRKPIDWWHEINAGNVSADEQTVTREAREVFSIRQGLSVPVLSGEYAIAGISVMSKNEDPEHFAQLIDDGLKDLEKLATRYHGKILLTKEEIQFFIRPLLESLNDTKKTVLKHLIIGQPLKTIEGVKERYAEQVVMKIRKDFGGITTNELLYILGMMNFNDFL
jgi:hypothetical protein